MHAAIKCALFLAGTTDYSLKFPHLLRTMHFLSTKKAVYVDRTSFSCILSTKKADSVDRKGIAAAETWQRSWKQKKHMNLEHKKESPDIY